MKNLSKILIVMGLTLCLSIEKLSAGPRGHLVDCYLHGVGFVGTTASTLSDTSSNNQQACFRSFGGDNALTKSAAHYAAHSLPPTNVGLVHNPTAPECFVGESAPINRI